MSLNSSILIFSGPSLTAEEGAKILSGAIYLPPVIQGDIPDAIKTYSPRIIGLVDGFFEFAPAVWHKDILYALSKGIHVFGASSMGALRASELDDFGMVGIGKIYENFASGILEDDDEVAVFHGPKELGYPALSEAMVNIRVTIDKAVKQNVISKTAGDSLIHHAKSLFYKDRSYANILSLASQDIKKLKDWLPGNKIDQKKIDAVEMLRAILSFKEQGPFVPGFQFNETIYWQRGQE